MLISYVELDHMLYIRLTTVLNFVTCTIISVRAGTGVNGCGSID